MTPDVEQAPTRVLIVAAHPDDPEFPCGGTVSKWTREGKEFHYLVCTRGDKGTADPTVSPDQLMAVREQEQRAAAESLGVKSVQFLDFRDGELTPSLALRGAIVEAIRRIRPDVVFTHDPATFYGTDFVNHPDHRAVGEAALSAVYPTARDRLQFPEQLAAGLQVHKVREIYMWGTLQPNMWVDITDTFDNKIAALKKHDSQVGQSPDLFERLRERSSQAAQSNGGGMELAEAFRKIALAR